MSQTFTLKGESSVLSANYYPPIELNEANSYSLGLVGFYTWNSIPNVEDGVNNTFTYNNKTLFIPTGSYEIKDLEKKIQELIKLNVDENSNLVDINYTTSDYNNNVLSLKPNNNTLKCELQSVYEIDFTSNSSIGRMLGFSSRILAANIRHESDLPVEICKVTSIRIECNITASAYYNNYLSHTLFEFSPVEDPGHKINIEPKNIIYLPVNAGTIDNITLRIVDQDGRLINFRGETIVIRLELKRML